MIILGILSIITNFGCHYTCPYCVVKCNGLDIPKTTIWGLESLQYCVYDQDRISLSGGGDPLFEYDKHKDWYEKLYEIQDKKNLRLDMHTSYTTLPADFDIKRYRKIVYHIRYNNYRKTLESLKRQGTEKVRVVFVVTDDFEESDLFWISDFVDNSPEIDELSFRQMIDSDYRPTYHLYNVLKIFHKDKWFYIEQDDYNTYYCENKLYTSYSFLGGKK